MEYQPKPGPVMRSCVYFISHLPNNDLQRLKHPVPVAFAVLLLGQHGWSNCDNAARQENDTLHNVTLLVRFIGLMPYQSADFGGPATKQRCLYAGHH